jgi:hypothetical protein
MKTTDFLQESAEKYEYDDEAGMVKNNLHTMVRVSVDLAKHLKENEDIPEWCQEKIAVAKSMIVAVMDYITSQHEMGHQPEVPGFDAEHAERAFEEFTKEAYDMDQLRRDADASLKASLDKQSDARIAALRNPPKKKGFMAQVGDKIIGGVAGAAKGFAGGTNAIKEDASAGSTCSPTIAVSMENLGTMPNNVIKRQQGYTNQMTKGGPVKVKKAR